VFKINNKVNNLTDNEVLSVVFLKAKNVRTIDFHRQQEMVAI
jgi:hypothetical protein